MGDSPAIDETLDLALDLLERGCNEETTTLALFLVENLVHVLDEYRNGSCSRCDVAGYEVARVGSQIIIFNPSCEVMDANLARKLAATLLRAAEMADQDQDG